MFANHMSAERVILILDERPLTSIAALHHMVRERRKYSASKTSSAATLSCSETRFN
jgi:hypothetical protein